MSEPIFEPVTSSTVAAMAFDEDNETMLLRFKNGAEYAYPDVSFSEYERIKNSRSIGHEISKMRGQRC